MAEALGRSVHTIRHQHASAMRKLGARNSVELTFVCHPERIGEAMSALNLVLHPGHIYCRECLMQIPATFLFCPCCNGFVREGNQWVPPVPTPKSPQAEEEQPLLFDTCVPEYSA